MTLRAIALVTRRKIATNCVMVRRIKTKTAIDCVMVRAIKINCSIKPATVIGCSKASHPSNRATEHVAGQQLRHRNLIVAQLFFLSLAIADFVRIIKL